MSAQPASLGDTKLHDSPGKGTLERRLFFAFPQMQALIDQLETPYRTCAQIGGRTATLPGIAVQYPNTNIEVGTDIIGTLYLGPAGQPRCV
jgi:hypothetical protein